MKKNVQVLFSLVGVEYQLLAGLAAEGWSSQIFPSPAFKTTLCTMHWLQFRLKYKLQQKMMLAHLILSLAEGTHTYVSVWMDSFRKIKKIWFQNSVLSLFIEGQNTKQLVLFNG